MTLSALGTCRYGDITFDGMMRSKVSATPVYDDAHRAVIYIKYTFDIRAYIYSAAISSTDEEMEEWRKQLLTPGLEFQYMGKGFGADFEVNTTTASLKDVVWGPHPESLDFSILGSNIAAIVNWRVSVCIPSCTGDAHYTKQLMAYNYEADYDISDRGYTTRTISGYVEIPMTRIAPGNRNLPDCADRYRDQLEVTFPLIDGFRRNQRYNISKDKRRLNFTITDTELPVSLPPGVTYCSMDHSVKSSMSHGFAIWTGSFTGSFTMANDYPKSQALDRFLAIVFSRLDNNTKPGLAAAANKPKIAQNANKIKNKGNYWMTGFSVREDIFDRTTNFNMDYVIAGCLLEDILQVAGMWEEIPNGNPSAWVASLKAIWGVRGISGLRLEPNDDVIIDLCLSNPKPSKLTEEPEDQDANEVPKKVDVVQAKKVPADANWLRFDNIIFVDEDDKVVRHKPIQVRRQGGERQENTGAQQLHSSLATNPEDLVKQALAIGTPTPQVPSVTPDTMQAIASPSYTVRMVGSGTRIQERVPLPRLRLFGGQTPTQVSLNYSEGAVGGIMGTPVYETTWDITYYIPSNPTGITPVMANPLLDTSGGQKA